MDKVIQSIVDFNPQDIDVKGTLDGTYTPAFPETIDNTMRSTYFGCGRKFLYEHILRRTTTETSIHLVAGKAFAEGLDVFRKSYWDVERGGDFEKAYAAGARALIREYGYDLERESSETWQSSPKSCERLLVAFDSYWKHFSPRTWPSKPAIIEGKVASEFSFAVPLPIDHPETGQPLVYHGRFDCIEEKDGKLWALDDKTATSLGPSWANQWDLRSQFIGYAWGAGQQGLQLHGTIARGTGILKTKITHMDVPVAHPPHLIERWYEQLCYDVERMLLDWRQGRWCYSLADTCAAYGGCRFKEVCLAKHQSRVLKQLPMRIWNPKDPAGSVIIPVNNW